MYALNSEKRLFSMRLIFRAFDNAPTKTVDSVVQNSVLAFGDGALFFRKFDVQLAVVALSWIVTAVRAIRDRCSEGWAEDDISWQIRRARELGVPLDSISFDGSNNLIDSRTGMPVNFGAGG